MRSDLEELTRIAGVPVFHLKDNYFAFRVGKEIHLLVGASGTGAPPIIREVVVDTDGFASLVAFLSEKHEDAYSWALVRSLLGEYDGHAR